MSQIPRIQTPNTAINLFQVMHLEINIRHRPQKPNHTMNATPQLNGSRSMWQLIRADWLGALATVVIAAVGIVQVIVYFQIKGQTNRLIDAANIQADAAKRSAGAAEKQFDAADKELALQREIARRAHGEARLTVYYVAVFHSDPDQSLRAGIDFRNDGEKDTEAIEVDAKVHFLAAPPRFAIDDFRNFKACNDGTAAISREAKKLCQMRHCRDWRLFWQNRECDALCMGRCSPH